MNLWASLLEMTKNQVFSGVAAASVFAYLGYVLRDLPKRFWQWTKWGFTCVLTVFSTDGAFDRVSEWIAAQPKFGRSRQLRITYSFDQDTRKETYAAAPGMGWHILRFGGKLLFVHRYEPGGPERATTIGQYTVKRNENIEVWTWGRSPETLAAVLTSIANSQSGDDANSLRVYIYRQGWRLLCRKAKRGMASVVLPGVQKSALVADLQEFQESADWYKDRGVPYRRGYLLEGPPGCGKTSLVMAVASMLSRPVYVLNLGSVLSDDDLVDAVSEVPEHAVLLIEDIDATKVSAVREEKKEGGQSVNITTREVTLSALLNCIDGAFAREGRVLFMTTNHPDKIDPALLRPGRTDRREHVGMMGLAEVAELCGRFFSDPREAMRFANTVKVPIAAAELQERLVQATRGRVQVAAE